MTHNGRLAVRRDVRNKMAPVYEMLPGSGPADDWASLPPSDSGPTGTVVYLDLLHWVALSGAKAEIPKFDSARPAYEALRAKITRGEIAIVLSGALYQEVAKIGPLDRRSRLADVMGELSSFRAIASVTNLLPMEFAHALHRAIGRPMFPRTDPIFGVGAGFAAGDPDLHGGIDVGPVEKDNLDAALREGLDVSFAEMDSEMRLIVEYLTLRGPGTRIPAGYDPAKLAAVHDERVQAELYLRAQLEADPAWVNRLDDIVPARALLHGIGEQLPMLIEPAGLSVSNFLNRGRGFVTDLIDDIPTMATENAMRARNHRNFQRDLTGNDIYDSDALRVAVPYCDLVATDRDAAACLRSTGTAARYGTVVVPTLAELVEQLGTTL